MMMMMLMMILPRTGNVDLQGHAQECGSRRTPATRRGTGRRLLLGAVLGVLSLGSVWGEEANDSATPADRLPFIRVSDDGRSFVADGGNDASPTPFKVWGFNYDHDADGRLLEDYWHDEWPTVEEDFREMKALGANVVRIHLQLGRFMLSADSPDEASLARLEQLVALAEDTGLYLDLTGLGCYHKADVPDWYDTLTEPERWAVQARFWEAVAEVCAPSPAIFCYDLMNEPILAGGEKVESEWLAGEFGGKHFVQRITLDLAGRTRTEVARAWVDTLVDAIRRHDRRHLVTVGVIPWAMVFPGAKPIFHGEEAGARLDFASIHVYPESGKQDRALDTLRSFAALGKPVVIEEIFPLRCSLDELRDFREASRPLCEGWIGFYWGRTIEEYGESPATIGEAITREWLKFFAEEASR